MSVEACEGEYWLLPVKEAVSVTEFSVRA